MWAGRIRGILDRSEQARVLVVGDLMLDRYVSGSVTRISPESPVPVVQVEKEWAGVGGAANVAANVVALGAQCDVVGCVGKDDAGRELRERLDELGVGAVRLLREEAHRGLAGCASVVLQDYDKGVLVPEVIQEVLDGARAEGAPAIVDPKRRRFFGYGSATVCSSRMRGNWRMPLESLFVLRTAFGWRGHARGWTANIFS